MIFLFDENISHKVVAALKALGHPVEHVSQIMPLGTPDETVFAEVASRGWVLVTQDKNIRRRPVQRRLLQQAGIGVFIFTGRAGRSNDQMTVLVLQRLEKMTKLAQRTAVPYIFGIPDRGDIERL